MVDFTKYNYKKRFPDWRDPPKECDACGESVIALVKNSVIYGKEYGKWPYIYLCGMCGASIGVHPFSVYPLGTMADRDTKALRTELHMRIDPKWQSGESTRHDVYARMASMLGFPKDRNFHIGELTKAECHKASDALRYLETAVDFGE